MNYLLKAMTVKKKMMLFAAGVLFFCLTAQAYGAAGSGQRNGDSSQTGGATGSGPAFIGISPTEGEAGNGHEMLHTSSILDDKCTTCHSNILTQEHLTNSTTQTLALSCDTCHNNIDTAVWDAIKTSNKNCAACHKEGHNILFEERSPLDLPLFDALKWTIPSDIKLWSGEPWVPAEYMTGGKVIMSSRSSDITAAEVWSYYQDQMASQGWTLVSTAPIDGQDAFTVTFTKDSQKMRLWFYGGANIGQSQPIFGGYKITIVYK